MLSNIYQNLSTNRVPEYSGIYLNSTCSYHCVSKSRWDYYRILHPFFTASHFYLEIGCFNIRWNNMERQEQKYGHNTELIWTYVYIYIYIIIIVYIYICICICIWLYLYLIVFVYTYGLVFSVGGLERWTMYINRFI